MVGWRVERAVTVRSRPALGKSSPKASDSRSHPSTAETGLRRSAEAHSAGAAAAGGGAAAAASAARAAREHRSQDSAPVADNSQRRSAAATGRCRRRDAGRAALRSLALTPRSRGRAPRFPRRCCASQKSRTDRGRRGHLGARRGLYSRSRQPLSAAVGGQQPFDFLPRESQLDNEPAPTCRS